MSYLRRGVTKFIFLPSVADVANITQAEIAAGTNLTSTTAKNLVSDFSGFDAKTSFIDTPHFASKQTPKIGGEIQSAESSMTFYEDQTDSNNSIRTTLARDVTGYILAVPAGITTAGAKADVFPIQVGANTRVYDSGNKAAEIKVDIAITGVPSADVTIHA